MRTRKSKVVKVLWHGEQAVFEAADRICAPVNVVVVKAAPFDGKSWVKELLSRPAGERTAQ